MQLIQSQGMPSGITKRRQWLSAILLVLLWFYLLVWGIFITIKAFQENEFEDWILAVTFLAPPIALTLYLIRCWLRKQAPRFNPWFPWVLRLMCVSVIFAMCDSWAFAERGYPLLTHITWRTKGQISGGIGFGYFLTCSTEVDDFGTDVWFWYAPCTVSLTYKHVAIHWLWNR
jgi:hypothetical protein